MSHYFHEEKLEDVHPIEVIYKQKRYEFFSAKGMFSKDRLDTGTRELLDSCQVPDKGAVLDLGCGIGVVGILLKSLHADLEVTQSDVTSRAVSLTRMNAKKHKVETTIVLTSVYEKLRDTKFDTILVNPPRAAGKKLIGEMISGALDHLNPQGSLQLVAMSNKGGKSYQAMMQEAFGNVEVIGRGSGFKVYKSVLA